jgi:ABC-2 type transport system permease protein
MTSTPAPVLHTRAPRPWSAIALGHLLRAEARKLPCSPAWWVLPIFVVGLAALSSGKDSDSQASNLQTALGVWSAMFAALYGVICITSEYRHHSITTSHLITANRSALILVKMALSALMGAAYALAGTAGSVAVMDLTGAHISDEIRPILENLAVGIPVVALFGVLGVGFGALVGRQLLAAFLSPYALWLLQTLVALSADSFRLPVLRGAEDYLPIGALIATMSEPTGGTGFDGGFGIGPQWWVEPLVFTSYVALIAVAGIARAQRRDIN